MKDKRLSSMIVLALATQGNNIVKKEGNDYRVDLADISCVLTREDFKKCLEVAKDVNSKALEGLKSLERSLPKPARARQR